jgi:hypothetical protein
VLGLGNVAIVGGVLLAVGGAITWLREDAINDTNAKWELKASQAALAAHNEVQERQLLVEKLQRALAIKEIAENEKAKLDEAELAKQATDFPLSPECMRCRVPNERLWLRGTPAVAPKSSGIGLKASPGS